MKSRISRRRRRIRSGGCAELDRADRGGGAAIAMRYSRNWKRRSAKWERTLAKPGVVEADVDDLQPGEASVFDGRFG